MMLGEWWKRVPQSVVYALLAALLVFGVWRAARHEMAEERTKYEQLIEQYREQARQALARSDSILAVVAERQLVIIRLEKQLADLRRRPPDTTGLGVLRDEVGRTYRTLGDSVRTAFGGIIPKQQQVIVKQDSVIQWQGRVILHQDTLLALKAVTIGDLQASNTTLRTALDKLPPLPPPQRKLWGFVPIPTRTQALIGGAVAGVAAGVVLSRQVQR